jgi:putative Holliday junction resolvase
MSRIVLGFDFGLARIGVATGQRVTSTATPLTVLKAKQGQPDWSEVTQIVETWQPELFVVGLPLNMDTSAGTLARLSTKFARRLQGRFGRPAHLIDERLSSLAARQLTTAAQIDDVAAALILETWLNEQSLLE